MNNNTSILPQSGYLACRELNLSVKFSLVVAFFVFTVRVSLIVGFTGVKFSQVVVFPIFVVRVLFVVMFAASIGVNLQTLIG